MVPYRWSFTSHPAPAGRGLDFIVRKPFFVEGLSMPQHSASTRFRTSVQISSDAWDVLPLLPRFHSRNRIITGLAVLNFVNWILAPYQDTAKRPWSGPLDWSRLGLRVFFHTSDDFGICNHCLNMSCDLGRLVLLVYHSGTLSLSLFLLTR